MMRRITLLVLLVVGMLAMGVAKEPRDRRAADGLAANYEVHEWGVFNFRGADNLVLPASQIPEFMQRIHGDEPEEPTPPEPRRWDEEPTADKPIIYFHSEQSMSARVSVEVPEGRMLYCWPPAQARAGSVVWPEVTILGPEISSRLPYMAVDDDEHWIHDARLPAPEVNRVRFDQNEESFLFYEARLELANPFMLDEAEDGSAIVLINNSGRELADVLLVYRRGGCGIVSEAGNMAVSGRGSAHALQLASANDIDVDEFVESWADNLKDRWSECGLTEAEIESLVEIWKDDFFRREGIRAICLMDREQYDELLPIQILPRPAELVRFGVFQVEF